MEEKGKYYSLIVSQIQHVKYLYADMKQWIKEHIEHQKQITLDQDEYNHSWEWAIADVFGDGCEYEEK